MENIEVINNAIDNLIKDIDRLQVQNRAIKKAYRKLELAFEKKSQELKQLEKSDASKEQSSIDYYGLYRELKAENKALKERLEKAELALKFAVKKLEDITGTCPIDCLKSDFKGCLNDDCKNQMKECWEKWCLEQAEAEKALKEKRK